MKPNNNFKEEVITVKRFFENENIDYNNYTFLEGEEPCDVLCVNTEQKFQVTWNEHIYQGMIRTQNHVSQMMKISDAVDSFIYNPIIKKTSQYRKSAKGIILLLVSSKEFPFHNSFLFEVIERVSNDTNNFFKSIYLVTPTRNIKIN